MKLQLMNFSSLLQIPLLTSILISPYLCATEESFEEDLLPEKDLKSVCETMRKLDKSLTTMYEELPMDEGDELLKQHRTYNQACSILLQGCLDDQNRAFMAAEDLLERGGPEFLDGDLQADRMEHRFNWDEDEVQEMKEEVKRTNMMWYDLWRLYNKVPIP